jgi:hypothetical protein
MILSGRRRGRFTPTQGGYTSLPQYVGRVDATRNGRYAHLAKRDGNVVTLQAFLKEEAVTSHEGKVTSHEGKVTSHEG